jgi:hypothetical protein
MYLLENLSCRDSWRISGETGIHRTRYLFTDMQMIFRLSPVRSGFAWVIEAAICFEFVLL